MGNGFGVALEPRRLRPGRRNRAKALQFAGEIREGQRLVERRPHVGVSAARTQEPTGRESENARERRGARISEHLRDRLIDRVPATQVEFDPGPEGEQIGPIQIEVTLAAVLEPVIDALARQSVVPIVSRDAGEIGEAPPDMLLEPRRVGQLDASPDLLPRSALAVRELNRADRAKGVGVALRILQPLGEVERLGAPIECSRPIVHAHAELCNLRVGHGERTARRLLLEQRHTFPDGHACLDGTPGPPEDSREPAQRVARLLCCTESAVTVQRLLPRLDRLFELPSEEALVRTVLEQFQTRLRRYVAGERDRTGILGGSLAVRSERRGTGPRCGSEAHHRIGIARRLGMVCQTGEVGFPVGRSFERQVPVDYVVCLVHVDRPLGGDIRSEEVAKVRCGADISDVSEYRPRLLGMLFELKPAVAHNIRYRYGTAVEELNGDLFFRAPNPPYGATLSYLLRSAPGGDAKVTITDASGNVVRSLTGPGTAGLHHVQWDLETDAAKAQGATGFGPGRDRTAVTLSERQRRRRVIPGTYTATLEVGSTKLTRPVVVRAEAGLRPEGGGSAARP